MEMVEMTKQVVVALRPSLWCQGSSNTMTLSNAPAPTFQGIHLRSSSCFTRAPKMRARKINCSSLIHRRSSNRKLVHYLKGRTTSRPRIGSQSTITKTIKMNTLTKSSTLQEVVNSNLLVIITKSPHRLPTKLANGRYSKDHKAITMNHRISKPAVLIRYWIVHSRKITIKQIIVEIEPQRRLYSRRWEQCMTIHPFFNLHFTNASFKIKTRKNLMQATSD